MEVDPGFGDLLQQAQQLTSDMDSGGDLPRVQRNLHQIAETGERLWSRTAQIGQDSTDVRASILLGSKGFDLPKISQKLEGLSTAKTFEPLEPLRDTDINGFLRNERENALLAAIEQARKNTSEETEKRHWSGLEEEWEREKQKILNALIGSGQDIRDFTQESESILSDSISMQGRSAMDNVEMAYARQVYMYNDAVIQGGTRPSLVDMFSEVANKLDDQNVIEIWQMVQHMVDIPLTASSNMLSARTGKKMQIALVGQALKYLELSYKSYIQKTIYGNLQKAQLGGIPGSYHLVKSFLNIRLPTNTPGLEDGLVDGTPVWAFVYYCIRCGDLNAALQVVNKAQQHLGEFPSYLKEYMGSDNRRLSHNNETKLRLQYRRSIRNCSDPYKRAVYCIIGCCDPKEDHSEVAEKTDDYLWTKLNQLSYDAGSNDTNTQQDRMTLQQLQVMMLEEYGESHFNAYQNPYLYFQVLLLTGQLEAAIDFLSRVERLRSHAVHVALTLHEMKMLLLPNSIQAQLLSKENADPSGIRRLNFSRLIMMYTRKFEATDPREALQYFYFLRDVKAPQGENLFMSCVSELVLETREFEMLLGRLERDGTRKHGAIDKFQADTGKIIELVALDTENKGLFEDAVKLYDLANNHDKVLELLNKLLVQVLSQAPSPQSNKDRLNQMAISIAERYRALGHEGTVSNTSTFYLLLDLMTFFDLYHTGKPDQAIDAMQHLKLLPFTMEDVDTKVNNFKHYTDEVRRSLPDVLLATMNILYTQYKHIRTSGAQGQSSLIGRGLVATSSDGGKETFINYLRSQAKSLITFAGMLPYRMPGDTNARLVQIEVLMN
ncbi:unnamed protein product [Owenia fusiformis]|uniref:Nuclear pore protein n=1 Tax=Owenia fusiformis TaxID=6347 RepID=A0A8S4NFS1_OWEFU|nr:unnamed protein product [Owenia fusiformis]